MGNAGLDESQAWIRLPGEITTIVNDADNTTPMAESAEELKSFLMRIKEESKKAGLKLNI